MSFFNRDTKERETTRVENQLRQQLRVAADNNANLRNALTLRCSLITNLQQQLRMVNRAIQRRNRVNKNQRAKLEAITKAAINLRLAQRNYMSDRGNDAFGNEVARASRELDHVLPPYTQEDKRLAMLNNRPVTAQRSEVDAISPGDGEVFEIKTGSPANIADERFV